MPITRDPATPPPVIGKIGPYTVFITPPSTPVSEMKKKDSPVQKKAPPVQLTPLKAQAPVHVPPPFQPGPVHVPPPVQPPPVQYYKSPAANPYGSGLGFFKNAVEKIQNAHASLDDHVARWFGLNQSKYQWALDNYYEGKEVDKVDTKPKGGSTKAQSV